MRRRRPPSAPPARLELFDGRPYKTTDEWEQAWGEHCAAIDHWVNESPQRGLLIPDVIGECPWDGTGY